MCYAHMRARVGGGGIKQLLTADQKAYVLALQSQLCIAIITKPNLALLKEAIDKVICGHAPSYTHQKYFSVQVEFEYGHFHRPSNNMTA